MSLSATDIQSYTLSLTRDFNAPREKVFQAWTDPEILVKWFGPQGVTTESAQIDLTVGGKYQFTLRLPDGQIATHQGEYREIDPPNRLVFTGILDGQGCEGSAGLYAETVISIEFEDMGSSTRLTLTHDFLPTEESKENHSFGWNGSFDRLAEILA
jgi:uncharacterized protein YndB with AHSA1/START domain